LVAGGTDAVDAADALPAVGVETAFSGITAAFLSSTRLVRITRRAGIANAAVGQAVLAVRAPAASRRTDGRYDWWHAQKIRFADEERQTDTLIRRLVATCSHAASHAFTALLAPSRHANLRLPTGIGGRADIGNTRSSSKGIAVVALQTGTGGALCRNNALAIITAQNILTG